MTTGAMYKTHDVHMSILYNHHFPKVRTLGDESALQPVKPIQLSILSATSASETPETMLPNVHSLSVGFSKNAPFRVC